MYERQHGGDLEVGSYAHRPILMDPDDIPSIAASALSPTELPFTQEDFEPQMEQALELVPDILGDERVGIRHAINGLLSLTPDGMPILGETPEVKGLWSAAAIWIKEAPGHRPDRRRVDDPRHARDRPARLRHRPLLRPPPDRPPTSRRAAAEGFNKTYGIVHPMEQWASNRDVRLTPDQRPPARARRGVLRGGRLGAAVLVRRQRAAARRVRRPGHAAREAEWESRWWSPIINAEHLAMRDRRRHGRPRRRSRSSTSAGPGALAYLQGLVVSQVDVPVGRVVYTPLLNEAGGIVADLTIMRLGHDLFRVVTGGGMGMRDKKWFVDHLPGRRLGPAPRRDVRAGTTLGVWGPRARDVLAAATADDVSNEGFPFGTCRTIDIGGVRALASRISYVGELGWEIYAPMEQGLRLWDALWEAGQPHGVVAGRDRRLRRRPAGSRRATAPTATSSSSTSTSSRPAWRGRRSRTPTSSARPPTSSSGRSRRPRSCAR